MAEKQYMVVDTERGLKIVVASQRNFSYSGYAVQFIGTKEECENEKLMLAKLDEGE